MLAKYTAIPCLILALSLSCALLPQRAQACSCSIAPIYNSDPADGEENVPLNVAVLISGAFRADSIVLQDASGESVAFTYEGGPVPICPGTSGDLIPKQPLRPNTRYVLKVVPIASDVGRSPTSLTFTTGSESLPDEEPTQPRATATVVSNAIFDGASCGSGNVRASIRVEDWKDVEVIVRNGDSIVLQWMLRTGEGDFRLATVPDCMEFRRRARTGRRSAPVVLCGEALEPEPIVEPPSAAANESDASVADDGEAAPSNTRDAATADGCSTAPGAPMTVLPMLIALATLSLARRRRT